MFRSIDAMALALEKLLGAALIVAVLYNFVNVLGRYVFGQTFVSAGLDARSQNAGIPMWIPHSAIVLGFGLIALVSVLQIVELLRKGEASDE
jgi:TRAP-type C4-dicarboxylate transport system permease small subunit